MRTILITGGAGGLGAALARRMNEAGWMVYVLDRDRPPPSSGGCWIPGDVRSFRANSLQAANVERLDVLVNCAGVNRAAWLADLREDAWDEVMNVNAKGIFLVTQACLPLMRRTGEDGFRTVCNVVSNASHVPMRTSLAYNASKGAAHIMTLQLARELSPEFTVFGLSPNKLAGTGMSRSIEAQTMRLRGWTAEQAADYQRKALLAGEETDPEAVAELLAWLLLEKRRHTYLTGCILPYGA